jgi:adhesin/invasin
MKRLGIALVACLALGCTAGTNSTPPAADASAVTLTTAPSTAASNRVTLPQQPIVPLVDSTGNFVARRGVVVMLESTPVSLTGPFTAITDDNERASFSSVMLAGALGTYALRFSPTGLAPALVNVTLRAGAPAIIFINGGNQHTANAGAALSISPSVLLTDVDANRVAQASVSFEVSAGGGTITGSPAVTNTLGIATLGSWKLGAVGLNTLVAHGTQTPLPSRSSQMRWHRRRC